MNTTIMYSLLTHIMYSLPLNFNGLCEALGAGATADSVLFPQGLCMTWTQPGTACKVCRTPPNEPTSHASVSNKSVSS
jgi:hypothetical protein